MDECRHLQLLHAHCMLMQPHVPAAGVVNPAAPRWLGLKCLPDCVAGEEESDRSRQLGMLHVRKASSRHAAGCTACLYCVFCRQLKREASRAAMIDDRWGQAGQAGEDRVPGSRRRSASLFLSPVRSVVSGMCTRGLSAVELWRLSVEDEQAGSRGVIGASKTRATGSRCATHHGTRRAQTDGSPRPALPSSRIRPSKRCPA